MKTVVLLAAVRMMVSLSWGFWQPSSHDRGAGELDLVAGLRFLPGLPAGFLAFFGSSPIGKRTKSR
jgi:hypothetical protein